MSRLTAIIVAAMAGSATAQSVTGSIQGSVVDQTGAVLPGVTVVVTNTATGGCAHDGDRCERDVPRGAVAGRRVRPVGGACKGSRRASRTGIDVTVGSTLTLRIEMRVSGVAESLTVLAASPILETTKSQVSSTVGEAAVRNLPVNGRNFINFALLTPGVTTDVRTGDISFAGQRGTLNSLVVDGADNNNTFFGQTIGRTGSGRAPYQFSASAVKEFQVNSNAYSAEYGRAGGAVINVVTKSGTNQPTGEIFEFYRDKSLNANNLINVLNNRDKSPYHYDQFGGYFGGPLQKDRHFVFFNYDGQRNTLPNLVFLNPPAEHADRRRHAGGARHAEPARRQLGAGPEPGHVPGQDGPRAERRQPAVAALQPPELQRPELRERRRAELARAHRRLQRPHAHVQRQPDDGARPGAVQRSCGFSGRRTRSPARPTARTRKRSSSRAGRRC